MTTGGDISIVGPRPERVEHVDLYTKEIPEFSYRLRVPAGLTGYAQIYGKYNTSARDKLLLDLLYIEQQSFLMDMRIVFLTVKIMFTPESTEGFEELKSNAINQKAKQENGTANAATANHVENVVFLSTDKAAYPINAMGISKAMMEHVVYANARVAAERGTTLCCTRYGNVMCSRGSVIPLFVEQIRAGHEITITDPNMTRFLMNLDEAVALVMFAFEHANPGDLFIQKADASTIGDLAKAVQQLFGDCGTRVIGTRHGEKLYETLMTREERLRSEDMGNYYRVAADSRDLNYDKFVVKGEVQTMADESYTSHNTNRLDVPGTVEKIMTTDYIKEQLANWGK